MPTRADPIANESELIRSVLIPTSRAESRFISTARIAFPVLLFLRNRKRPSETRTLPTEAANFGILSWTVPRLQVPLRSGFSISRKSGVHSITAKLARKMLTPKVTTSWARTGPVITLLTMNR